MFPFFAGIELGGVEKVGMVMLLGPVSVELEGVVQFTLNFQTRVAYAPQIDAIRFSRFAGGVPVTGWKLLGNALNTEKPQPADGEIAAAKPPQPGQLGEGNGGR